MGGKNVKQSDHSSAHHWAWQSSQFASDVAHQVPSSAYEPQVGHQSPSNSVSAVDHQQQRPADPPPVSPTGRGVGAETGFGVGAKMGRGVGAGTGGSEPPPSPVDEHHAIPQFSQFAWPVPQ